MISCWGWGWTGLCSLIFFLQELEYVFEELLLFLQMQPGARLVDVDELGVGEETLDSRLVTLTDV